MTAVVSFYTFITNVRSFQILTMAFRKPRAMAKTSDMALTSNIQLVATVTVGSTRYQTDVGRTSVHEMSNDKYQKFFLKLSSQITTPSLLQPHETASANDNIDSAHRSSKVSPPPVFFSVMDRWLGRRRDARFVLPGSTAAIQGVPIRPESLTLVLISDRTTRTFF
jgi:hypothetical protein